MILAVDGAGRPVIAGAVDGQRDREVRSERRRGRVDTLDGFLREMKTRFPDATARAPLPPETARPDPFSTGSLPEIVGLKRVGVTR